MQSEEISQLVQKQSESEYFYSDDDNDDYDDDNDDLVKLFDLLLELLAVNIGNVNSTRRVFDLLLDLIHLTQSGFYAIVNNHQHHSHHLLFHRSSQSSSF